MGSEMCIRDSAYAEGVLAAANAIAAHIDGAPLVNPWEEDI